MQSRHRSESDTGAHPPKGENTIWPLGIGQLVLAGAKVSDFKIALDICCLTVQVLGLDAPIPLGFPVLRRVHLVVRDTSPTTSL